MSTSRNAWMAGAAGLLAVLCVAGCAAPSLKPPLSVDAQAEALSHFSLGLLAEASGDSAAALRELEAAIRLDPDTENLYVPAVAVALKLKQPDEALRLARQLNKKRPRELNSLLLLARVYALTDRPAEAETVFKQAVSEFPEDPESHLNLARFFITQNQLPKAIRTLEPALELPAEQTNLYHLLGTLTIESARDLSDPLNARMTILKGINLLKKSLEIDPSDPGRWQQLGYVHLSIKQFNEALEALKKARTGMPDDLMLARQVLDICIQTGLLDHALDLSNQLPSQTGTTPEVWLQYLAERTPTQHRDRLIECLEEYLLQADPPVFYYAQLSSLYLDEKRYAEAEVMLSKALEAYPENGRLRTVLGTLLLQQENYDEAYAAFSRVRSGSPDAEWAQSPFFAYNFIVAAQKTDHFEEAVATLASTYTNDAVVLNQYMHSLLTGQPSVSPGEAIDLLESFHQLSPEATEVLYYLSLLQAVEEDYEAALGNARRFEVLAQDQGNTNLLTGFFYYRYASLLERTGQLAEAEKVFFKAIDLGAPSTTAAAQNYLAYMWAERGEKLEMGLALIRKALASDPENAAFIDTLGWIYYMQERYEDALEQLKTASELIQSDPTIWEHLGDTYLKLGNPTAAKEHWKKGLELDPDEQRLLDRLGKERISPVDRPAGENGPEDTPRHP